MAVQCGRDMDFSEMEDEMQRDKMIDVGMGSCSNMIKREPGISREIATNMILMDRDRNIPIGICAVIGNDVRIDTL